MKVFNSYSEFEKKCPINQDTVIKHILTTFFEGYSDKKWRTAHSNLTLIIRETFRLAEVMGFAKMSVRDLHKATGISIGGLYSYFESKEKLESMIIEGLSYITTFSAGALDREDVPEEIRLEQAIRGGVYLSQMFQPWYYFVFMEIRTMTPENMAKARELELGYLLKLTLLLHDNSLIACDMAVIIQNWHLKQWKFKTISVDHFTEHALRIARLLREESRIIAEQQLFPKLVLKGAETVLA